MPSMVKERLSFFRETIWRRWVKLVNGFIFLVGTFGLIRDEFLPPKYHDIHLIKWIPQWSLSTWLLIFLLVLFAAFFESAYRRVGVLRREIQELRNPGFDVLFDYAQAPFYHNGTFRASDGELTTFELYRIGIKNHHAPQDIKVRIAAIDGSSEFDGALPLPLQFQHDSSASLQSKKLTADELAFVDVVMLSSTTTRGVVCTLQHIVSGLDKRIKSEPPFKLKIEVLGTNAIVEKWFEVFLKTDSVLSRVFQMHLIE